MLFLQLCSTTLFPFLNSNYPQREGRCSFVVMSLWPLSSSKQDFLQPTSWHVAAWAYLSLHIYLNFRCMLLDWGQNRARWCTVQMGYTIHQIGPLKWHPVSVKNFPLHPMLEAAADAIWEWAVIQNDVYSWEHAGSAHAYVSYLTRHWLWFSKHCADKSRLWWGISVACNFMIFSFYSGNSKKKKWRK